VNFFLYWHEFKNSLAVEFLLLAGRETWVQHCQCSGDTNWNAMGTANFPRNPKNPRLCVCVCVCVCVCQCAGKVKASVFSGERRRLHNSDFLTIAAMGFGVNASINVVSF
jgi:hypothetical protein